MPRAREVFVKEYYPEHYDSFLRDKQKGYQKGYWEGIQEGRREGELVGEIRMLQRILKKPVSPKNELFGRDIPELQVLANTLHTEWMRVD